MREHKHLITDKYRIKVIQSGREIRYFDCIYPDECGFTNFWDYMRETYGDYEWNINREDRSIEIVKDGETAVVWLELTRLVEVDADEKENNRLFDAIENLYR